MSDLDHRSEAGPLVSIGIPVYNEEHSIAGAIESILAQDYPHFELIISDNASTDRTEEICRSYAARDHRIRYVRNETNLGAFRNFNSLIERATGEYFAWVGGHDRWHPTFLGKCVEPLREDPSVVLAHAQVTFIDDEDKPLKKLPGYLDTRCHLNRLIRYNIVIWSLTRCFEVYGLMRLSALRQTFQVADVYASDYALLVELAFLGTFAHIPEPLFFARAPITDAEATFEKLFARKLTRWEVHMLFWKFLLHLTRIVRKHVRTLRGKAFAIFLLLICAPVRHAPMLKFIRSYRPARPERVRERRVVRREPARQGSSAG